MDQLQINDAGRLKGISHLNCMIHFDFPFDLTRLIAAEKVVWDVDEEGFNHELSCQKERSRADAKNLF
ncbi:MAG: hypothetical protein U0T81_00470 [Saprospiraceae bacterium]